MALVAVFRLKEVEPVAEGKQIVPIALSEGVGCLDLLAKPSDRLSGVVRHPLVTLVQAMGIKLLVSCSPSALVTALREWSSSPASETPTWSDGGRAVGRPNNGSDAHTDNN